MISVFAYVSHELADLYAAYNRTAYWLIRSCESVHERFSTIKIIIEENNINFQELMSIIEILRIVDNLSNHYNDFDATKSYYFGDDWKYSICSADILEYLEQSGYSLDMFQHERLDLNDLFERTISEALNDGIINSEDYMIFEFSCHYIISRAEAYIGITLTEDEQLVSYAHEIGCDKELVNQWFHYYMEAKAQSGI